MFRKTPWMISVDAAEDEYAPFAENEDLHEALVRRLRRLVPLPAAREGERAELERHGPRPLEAAPAGGEISYYTAHDQKEALAVDGPHGIPFENAAAEFHITFMIANDQPKYRPMDRLRSAGLACGYRFQVTGVRGERRRGRG